MRQVLPRPAARAATLAAAAVLVTGELAAPGGAATTIGPRTPAARAPSRAARSPRPLQNAYQIAS